MFWDSDLMWFSEDNFFVLIMDAFERLSTHETENNSLPQNLPFFYFSNNSFQ